MNEMITIEHDYDSPAYDKAIERATKWHEANDRNPDCRNKRDFELHRSCGKVFTGREEIGYANI